MKNIQKHAFSKKGGLELFESGQIKRKCRLAIGNGQFHFDSKMRRERGKKEREKEKKERKE